MSLPISKCACGSGNEFAVCCEPYLQNRAAAPTAEKLMRSRYVAYTLADMDYILRTTHPSSRSDFDPEASLEWAKNSEWEGLQIVSKTLGAETDDRGEVEFIASYKANKESHRHHELSEFKKEKGQWYFVTGKLVKKPIINSAKIGRNDSCPCGSGKKYKNCCAAAS